MNQTAKDDILETIRQGKPEPQPLPEIPLPGYHGDPVEGFIRNLLFFDGRAVKFGSRQEAVDWLLAQPELDFKSQTVYSSANDVKGNFTETDLADLTSAGKIDTCITNGVMGVGEMGSIWVTDESLVHPVTALLAKRLYIFLDSKQIIGGMAQAYESITLGHHQYGSFFTGPSATADIEAVHITGAQGPLAMTALIYNCADAPVPPEVLAPEAG